MGPLGLTVPSAWAIQPCRIEPSGVTSLPVPSKSSEPARVNSCSPPVPRVTKKPSPSIMKSVDRPVDWVAPWVQLVVIAATFTPRPTCAGFVPPRSAAGAPPARITCESVSWKTVWDPLKPTVLTLAMLLPVTSILVWCARRPEMAENMERSTGGSPQVSGSPVGGERSGGSGGLADGDLGEAADGDLGAVDDGHGLAVAAGEPDRGDDAGLGRAGRIGVGGGPPDEGAGGGRLLEGQHRRVLVDQLLQLLDLAEGRRLGHHLAAVHRVARVLVTHLGHQELHEDVLAHLVGTVDRGGRRGVGRSLGTGHACCRHRSVAPSQTRTSTPDDVDRFRGGVGPLTEISAGAPRGRDRSSPRSCWPPRRPKACGSVCGCAEWRPGQDPPVSRSTSSREQFSPALSRSRRRSGSPSRSAARPCSCAPRRVRSTVPFVTVIETSTGPRFSGSRTSVMVCVPSGPPRRTAT